MANATIGVDARYLLRPLRGMPLYVHYLCEFLPRVGSEYDFIFFINKGYEHNVKETEIELILNKIKGKYTNVKFVNYDSSGEIFWEQVVLPLLVKKYKVNLLHMPGNRAPFICGVPVVTTLHDVMEFLFLPTRLKYELRKAGNILDYIYIIRIFSYKYLMYKLFKIAARKIVTVSNHSKKDIQKTINFKKEIDVIYHGLPAGFSTEKTVLREDRKYILMLGGDSEQKNPKLAIEAYSKINPILREKYPLRIVGFCGADDSIIMKTIKKCSIADNVIIKGWVDQEEIIYSFRNALVFLFPSKYEGFGFPLLQSMATGTPFVTTNTACMPEIAGSVGGKVSPDDTDGFEKAINQLVSDESNWSEQQKLGLKRVEMFSWESCVSNHLTTYESLLK